MKKELKSYIAVKFNRLTISADIPNTSPRKVYCICECGKEKTTRLSSVLCGKTQSCGCAYKKINSKHLTTHPVYKTWSQLKQRCNNPNNAKYPRYGGRGIKLCEEWVSFEKFLLDMGERPQGDYSIERRDNNKGYYKENCYWATRVVQMNNTERNHFISYEGENKTVAEWSRILNMPYYFILHNIRKGVSLPDIVIENIIKNEKNNNCLSAVM